MVTGANEGDDDVGRLVTGITVKGVDVDEGFDVGSEDEVGIPDGKLEVESARDGNDVVEAID